MTIGPRVLKTGLSVTLALYICSFFELEPAIFAGVAAIFTIQPSIYRTWKHVLDQAATNTLGAAIALFAIYFIGNQPIVIGLVMIIVIMIGLKLKMESSITLALVTVLAIMSAPGDEDWLFALNRFGIILIGIGSAFLVNLLILPPKYKLNYIEKQRSVFQNFSLLLRTVVSNEMTEKAFQEDRDKLEKDILKLADLFKIFDEEREKMARLNPMNVREIVIFKQMLKVLEHGLSLLDIIEEHYFQSRTNKEENQLFDNHLEFLVKCHEHILLKYDRKVKMDENNFGDDFVDESSHFLERMMEEYSREGEKKLRLVVISASIFEYAFQLQRLNQLIERFNQKQLKK